MAAEQAEHAKAAAAEALAAAEKQRGKGCEAQSALASGPSRSGGSGRTPRRG